MAKLWIFQHHYSSVSHDPLEIILICRFGAQESFLGIFDVDLTFVLSQFNAFFLKVLIFLFLSLTPNLDIWRMSVNKQSMNPQKYNEVNGVHQLFGYRHYSEYLFLCVCSAWERNSYRLGTTWGWGNDDNIAILKWVIISLRY